MSYRVLKADGTSEYFKIEKLRRSLRRSGATPEEVIEITRSVSEKLYDGIRTQEIYRYAFDELRKSELPTAARYSLRRALFNLGPTGFPFEQYLARLFTALGYTTAVGNTIAGHCAVHEIDVAAYRPEHTFVAEAKFHARAGTKSDLQVVMYCYARLLDLRDARVCSEDYCGIKEFWVITNTKFTSAAERYGSCVGLKLLSWDYPKRDNLHDLIQRLGMYPITVLSSLTPTQVATLIAHNILVCQDLVEKPHILRHLHLPERRQERILAEALQVTPNKS